MRRLKKKLCVGLAALIATGAGSALLLRPLPQLKMVPQAAPLVGNLDTSRIPESSGIIASRRQKGVYWTLSDSGNKASLFAITRDGTVLAEYPVNAANHDWEDLTTDEEGHLYVADTGNNGRQRRSVQVLRLHEPDLSRPVEPISLDHCYDLIFPDLARNIEGLFVRGGRGYLVTKARPGEETLLYDFTLAGDKRSQTLRLMDWIPALGQVTAAAFEEGRLALLSFGELTVFSTSDEPRRFVSASRQRVPLAQPHRMEAICFAEGGLLLTAESGEMYLFPRP